MKRRLRILYLAPCWPGAQSFGMQLRAAHIAGALQELGELDYVVVKVADNGETLESHAGGPVGVTRFIKLVPRGSRSLWERGRCSLDSRFMGYLGHCAPEQDRTFVLNELSKYDLVWFYRLETANYLDRWSWPRSVLDVDDIPSTFYRSVWRQGGNRRERLWAGIQMLAAKRRERLLPERFTLLSVSSDADRDYLGLGGKVRVIPNGFTRPVAEPLRRISDPPRIGFIGKFGFPPNEEGMKWFVEKCWPSIKRAVPDVGLRIVGWGGERLWGNRDPNIEVLGWVEDPSVEISTWSAMVVPLWMGAGTRVKIAEGFSRKCPIISTSFGAYGYEVANGRELLLADSAEDFANACVRAIRQPAEMEAMAERAWQIFLQKWTWEGIRPRVLAVAEECLAQTVGV